MPCFDDSQAESGKLTNCPTGSANSTNPNAASVKCNALLMSGIRLAQVEKVRPATKKKALTAILYIRGCIVSVVFIINLSVHNHLFLCCYSAHLTLNFTLALGSSYKTSIIIFVINSNSILKKLPVILKIDITRFNISRQKKIGIEVL